MSLASAYKIIRPSVVAIAARGSTRPDFPLIIGTGVIVDADGYILTNDHVLEALVRLPRRPGAPPEEWPGMVLLFHLIPEKGMATIPLEIVGVAKLGMNPVPENYYGGQPDLGIIHVGQVKGLPAAKIGPADLPVGSDIGILGFPMGTDTLAAPGWIHQVTPTLQRGIISAQLPYECEAPHELMIDAVIEGGASG